VINPFTYGEHKVFTTRVSEDKLATFESGTVHPVYSTFALGRDAEWACRLFVLEMKQEGEEGIGSYLSVEHISPALLNSEVVITAILDSVIKNEITCSWQAVSGGRIIGRGKQVQKIIRKDKFDALIDSLKNTI